MESYDEVGRLESYDGWSIGGSCGRRWDGVGLGCKEWVIMEEFMCREREGDMQGEGELHAKSARHREDELDWSANTSPADLRRLLGGEAGPSKSSMDRIRGIPASFT